MQPDSIFFQDLAVVFLAAVAGGVLARIAGQPLILGYVLGGIAIGPFTPGLTISGSHTFDLFAENPLNSRDAIHALLLPAVHEKIRLLAASPALATVERRALSGTGMSALAGVAPRSGGQRMIAASWPALASVPSERRTRAG